MITKNCYFLILLLAGIPTLRLDAQYSLRTEKSYYSINTILEKRLHIKADKKMVHEMRSDVFFVTTPRGVKIRSSLYRNNKQSLIVIGLGKGADQKAYGIYIAALSNFYDVLVFEYEWQVNKPSLYDKIFHLVKTYFTYNHDEVLSVVGYIRNNTDSFKYDQIIGLGECYSGFMFVKAQALAKKNNEKLFDKLILDSVFLSLDMFIAAIIKDPCMSCDPLKGGMPKIIKPLFLIPYWTMYKPIAALLRPHLEGVSMLHYLPDISIPLLYIRGANDPAITDDHFTSLWNSIGSCEKAAFITPFHHSNSFQRAGRAYYLDILRNFIDSDFMQFTQIWGQ